jgi:hypothetical protein
VCAGCHPGEAALHDRSGHARTLRRAVKRTISRRLDGTTVPDPEQPETHWSFHLLDGRFRIERRGHDQTSHWVVDYAFGSGRHATTFVTLTDPTVPKLLEHRLTYYTARQALDVTPGQGAHIRSADIKRHGREPSPQEARKCFRCHSTELSAHGDERIDESTMIASVSCERCHGPGRAHVEAARGDAPNPELALPLGPGRDSAEAQLKLCGACHRHPSRAHPGDITEDDPRLARFQPVGLMQSKCYLKSGGALSCVTCHDPHARASADRQSYEAACLHCHVPGSPAAGSGRPDEATSSGRSCPVSPAERCVECHMPRVDSGQHVLFTDHWIRVRKGGVPASPKDLPAPTLDLID